MDFFENQDEARKRTSRLLVFFIPAVAATVLVISFFIYLTVILGIFAHIIFSKGIYSPEYNACAWWRPGMFWAITVLTGSAVVLMSYMKSKGLARGGGDGIALMMGAKPVLPGTKNPDERKLMNVVEEMAIAAGVPVPSVYIMDIEDVINGFAAGFSPTDAVICVTQGCISHLSRDEIQGIVAHEFSHILNGDMLLNLRLIGLLHGILIITMTSKRIMLLLQRIGDPRAILIFFAGMCIWIFGSTGHFFANVIKCAMSRQREYLADASAVQFTRNPSGLANALKKIGGVVKGSYVNHLNSEIVSHLFFARGLKKPMFKSTATHPPLESRILRLDPQFDGTYPKLKPKGYMPTPLTEQYPGKKKAEEKAEEKKEEIPPVSELAQPEMPFVPVLEPGNLSAITPEDVVSSVGTLNPGLIAYASLLLAGIPQKLKDIAHEPFSARAMVYCLLLDKNDKTRKVQLESLKKHSPMNVWNEVERLIPVVDAVKDEHRLPLIDMALPALKLLSKMQYVNFRSNIKGLAEADKKISLFEYTLQCSIIRHLDPVFIKPDDMSIRYKTLEPLIIECFELLSVIAWKGSKADYANKAFKIAMSELMTGKEPTILPEEKCSLSILDRSLDKLSVAAPQIKKQVLKACTECVLADSEVTIAEAELLRAIADSLHCPVPPFVPGKTT